MESHEDRLDAVTAQFTALRSLVTALVETHQNASELAKEFQLQILATETVLLNHSVTDAHLERVRQSHAIFAQLFE